MDQYVRFFKGSFILNPDTQFSNTNYAQTLIVVVLIVVNFGGFLVIARNPPDEF